MSQRRSNVVPFPYREPRLLPYLNGPEEAFTQFAQSRQWLYTKRGWPDFLCQSRNGEWFAVEVKRRLKSGRLGALRGDQIACLDWLTSLGVRCYLSDGNSLERYSEAHRRNAPRFKGIAAPLRG